MNLIAEATKRLPHPLKVIIHPFYNRWAVVLDKEMIQNIMEYFDLSHNETIYMLRLGCKLNAAYWRMFHLKNKEEISRFYEVTPFYVFDLAYWHMGRGMRRFMEEISAVASGDTLDYGGGIGDLSSKLAAKGLNVTYADVSGITLNFARWLFKKRSQNVQIIDLTHEELTGNYSTIICTDVIEHVPNPKASLEMMARILKPGGRLIITNLGSLEATELHPMHQKILFNAEELLNSRGLFRADRQWLWVKSTGAPKNNIAKAR